MTQLERCPWCGSEITHAKFVEIEAKIRADEQRNAKADEAKTRKKLEEEYKLRLENDKKKWTSTAKEQNELALKAMAEQHQKQVHETKQTEKALKSQLEKQEKQLKAKDKEIDKLVDEKVNEQRSILDSQHQKDLARSENAHKREMGKMQDELKKLNRRLEKKTANELGEVPEIDLFEKLREEFPDDKIIRVKRGEAGADIHHTVMHKGRNCGLIVLDSKNHLGWRNDFAIKLHQDQIDAKADHAVLSINVFPVGKKEMCIVNGVIAISPARVTCIVELLRSAMVSLHMQGLSKQQRQTKIEQLYRMITSDEFAKKLTDAMQTAQEILDLDVDEQKQHQKTWKSRGRLTTSLKKALCAIEDDVFTIIGGKGTEECDDGQPCRQEEVTF